MKKYNSGAACIKCGCRVDIKDTYHPEHIITDLEKGLYKVFTGQALTKEKSPERIKRVCENCGYTWNEAPLNKED
jgi:hypothetical protein